MTATAQAMRLLRQQLGAEVVSDTGPDVMEVRPLRHGLAAVLVPHGMARAEENQLRAALDVATRPANRRKSA